MSNNNTYTKMSNENTTTDNNLVLVCVDACDHSMRAFDWYMKYFHHPHHNIGLVHVYAKPELPPCGYKPDSYSCAYNQLLEEQVSIHSPRGESL